MALPRHGTLKGSERITLAIGLLAMVAAGVSRYAGAPAVLAFLLAAIALAALASIVSFATEQVSERFGPAVRPVRNNGRDPALSAEEAGRHVGPQETAHSPRTSGPATASTRGAPPPQLARLLDCARRSAVRSSRRPAPAGRGRAAPSYELGQRQTAGRKCAHPRRSLLSPRECAQNGRRFATSRAPDDNAFIN